MRVMVRGFGIGAATLLLGCLGKRQALDVIAPPEDALGPMAATPDNALVTVGGTVQIGMSVVSLAGTPLTTFDSVNYFQATISDTVSVRVNSAGLVTGLTPTASSIPVNVVAFRKGLWNGDQILVMVTPTAVSGLTLSIQPPAGDSAKLASGTLKTITPVLRNTTTGQSIAAQLQYVVQPQDESRVGVFTGRVAVNRIPGAVTVHAGYSPAAARNQIIPYVSEGSAWIYANVNAYGTLLQDSVRYTFTYPYTGSVRVVKTNLAVQTVLNAGLATSAAENPSIILAPGGTVTFSNGNASTDPLTVAFSFDNPAAATVATLPSSVGGTTGNVTTLIGGQNATRRFLTPGTYRWTWVTSGGPGPWPGQTSTGTVVVK